MKYSRQLLILLLGALPCSVMARAPEPPLPVTRVETNLGKGCRITVTLPDSLDGGIGGDASYASGGLEVNPLPKSWQFKSFRKLYFGLTCHDAEKFKDGDDTVSFDPQSGTWKKDVTKRMEKAFGFEMSPQEYQRIYQKQDKAIRVYNVTAVNASGFASTVDDTTGDERKRQKDLGFCLFNPPKALCGGGVVGYLADGPKSDLTQRALEIIRTIEFLPDEE